jgi:nucleoside-diphosphate-sugar epimerase
MDTRKIFVAGSTGFLGSNIIRYFLRTGHEIYSLIRNNSNNWRIDDVIDQLNVIRIDSLSSLKFCNTMEQIDPDVVVNAMGADQKATANNASLNWHSNFLSLVDLVNSMRFLKDSVLIHAGSSFEYGNATRICNPISEDTKCEPVSEYALSKVFATDYLRYFSLKHPLKIFIFRIFNLYGPYEAKDRLIPEICIRSIMGETITLKNPMVSRDFIHVGDVAGAFQTAIFENDIHQNFNIFNLGTGVSTSVADLASYVNGINGNRSEIVASPGDQRPENMIPGPIADMNRTEDLLKWKAKYDLKRGLYDVNQWFKENVHMYEV